MKVVVLQLLNKIGLGSFFFSFFLFFEKNWIGFSVLRVEMELLVSALTKFGINDNWKPYIIFNDS